MQANQIVEIYTDGACIGNPGPGGWGALLRCGDQETELYGGEPCTTTNNRMELMASIRALTALERPSLVRLYTDSAYVKDGITSWLPKWKTNGWLTSAKKPVKNTDLWRRLEEAAVPHTVQWFWVKGHAGHPQNERADRLAARGAQEAAAASLRTRQRCPTPASLDKPSQSRAGPVGSCRVHNPISQNGERYAATDSRGRSVDELALFTI